ncbi:cobalt ECF transporter T component CbiQ [Planctomycetales bacterium]|nr:cobalt ECF transporter T component CbiQ [Planctomycetales bacterium]GHT03556.1 cobalt ECF transporter T component CbiQ [Planctomycetales bacterium]
MSLSRVVNNFDQLDRLALGVSTVHRLHPLVKMLTTSFYLVAVVSLPSSALTALALFAAYPLAAMTLSQTPWRPLLARLALAMPFSLMGGLGNVWVNQQTAFYCGDWVITQGEISLVSIMLKTALTVLAVLILMATTPFVALCAQLEKLRVPKIVRLQLAMTYRYIATLLDEAATMTIAYRLRAPRQKNIRWRDIGSFLGQLLARSIDRAERVYQAMQCRGFNGEYPAPRPAPPRARDYLYLTLFTVALLAGRWLEFRV